MVIRIAKLMALVSWVLLLGCLLEHPVLTDETAIDVSKALKDSAASIPAARWEVLRIENGDTSVVFDGTSKQFDSIPKILVANGARVTVSIRAYSLADGICYEATLDGEWVSRYPPNCMDPK